ncbi:DUF928 domain-containing protein [Brasilonema sp. UFV-L1]|uniref:DUF928 domain-containing protein n=1 Tax=Brasilonema sp. UFV-L1 TaxID=2234130 RepID=UPI00145D2DC3|nr:DUF928 domain-containing protein [Brasilonema sp. UFV-L1]NMG10213.1 hypothetical protein [Brasilonema sp. UFV-L1]
MFQTQSFVAQWLRAVFSLTLTLILFIGYPSQALAQNNQTDNPFEVALEQIKFLFFPPTKLGAPVGRTRGPAGRGRCPALASLESNEPGIDPLPLSALVPTISNPLNKVEQLPRPESSKIVWGKTTEAYPTFWFYIPYVYEESELEYAKFVLLDEDRHIVAGPIFFQLPNKTDVAEKPSIAKFTLPRNEKPLEIGKLYNWYFSIVCNERKPSRNPSVTGWIQRVSLPILAPKDYMYYVNQGIWYDTVTRLVESRIPSTQAQINAVPLSTEKSLTNSQSQVEEDWVTLLQYLNLDDKQQSNKIAKAPIVELSPVSKGELQ